MIVLTTDPESVVLNVGSEGLCVRHKAYAPVRTRPGCPAVTYEELEADFQSLIKGRTTLIAVGLNRIITPSNRARVGALLLKPRKGLVRKISVDATLFVAEPWRAYFHFGFTRQRYKEFTYSYLAESRWRAAQDGVGADPFSFDAICAEGAGVLVSKYRKLFGELDARRVELPPGVHAEYQEEKAAAFDEETTIAGVLSRLGRFAQAALPERSVPTLAQFFRKPRPIVQTDLKVDDYLVGILRDRAGMIDALGEHFYAD